MAETFYPNHSVRPFHYYSPSDVVFIKIESVLSNSSLRTSNISPVRLILTSTTPSTAFFPTVIRIGQPIKSASANFTPARSLRSSTILRSPLRSSLLQLLVIVLFDTHLSHSFGPRVNQMAQFLLAN